MSQPQRDVSPPHVPPSHRAVITVTISGDILHSLDCTDLFITISSSLVSTSITFWHPVLPPHNVGPKLYLVIDTKWCWSTKTPTWLRSCDVGRSGLLVFICIIKSGEYRAHAHSIIMLEGWEVENHGNVLISSICCGTNWGEYMETQQDSFVWILQTNPYLLGDEGRHY